MRKFPSGEQMAAPKADNTCRKMSCCPEHRDMKKAQNLLPPSALTPDALRATQEPHLPPVAVATVAKLTYNTSSFVSPKQQSLGGQASPFQLYFPLTQFHSHSLRLLLVQMEAGMKQFILPWLSAKSTCLKRSTIPRPRWFKVRDRSALSVSLS